MSNKIQDKQSFVISGRTYITRRKRSIEESKNVTALLTAGFNEAIDRKLAPIEEDISKVKEENEYRNDRMENMERKIDEYEQQDRENSVIKKETEQLSHQDQC